MRARVLSYLGKPESLGLSGPIGVYRGQSGGITGQKHSQTDKQPERLTRIRVGPEPNLGPSGPIWAYAYPGLSGGTTGWKTDSQTDEQPEKLTRVQPEPEEEPILHVPPGRQLARHCHCHYLLPITKDKALNLA